MDRDILIGEGDDGGGIVNAVTEFLGIQTEQYVCPDCGVACEESTTYNPDTVAFDGGTCPSWYCEECDSHYIREEDDERYTLDLYGQGMD